jgi:hypothetical protein
LPGKSFSPELYAAHDAEIKQLVIERLPHALMLLDPLRWDGLVLEENSNLYAVDLIGVTHQGEKVAVEVEHKLTREWDETFPYKTLDIPGRKAKFARLDGVVWFVLVNHDKTRMAVTISSVLNVIAPTPKTTKYSVNELFFNVPLSEVRFFPLKGWKE